MHPELKAYIEVVGGCPAKVGVSRPQRIDVMREQLRRRISTTVGLVGEFLDTVGPYCCELRPISKVRTALAACCRHRDGMSYHGLS